MLMRRASKGVARLPATPRVGLRRRSFAALPDQLLPGYSLPEFLEELFVHHSEQLIGIPGRCAAATAADREAAWELEAILNPYAGDRSMVSLDDLMGPRRALAAARLITLAEEEELPAVERWSKAEADALAFASLLSPLAVAAQTLFQEVLDAVDRSSDYSPVENRGFFEPWVEQRDEMLLAPQAHADSFLHTLEALLSAPALSRALGSGQTLGDEIAHRKIGEAIARFETVRILESGTADSPRVRAEAARLGYRPRRRSGSQVFWRRYTQRA